jgi:predicted DNA-binding protein
MAEKIKVRREDSIRIRLSGDMLERLHKVSERIGMPAATFAAFAVGKAVQSEEFSFRVAGKMAVDLADSALSDLVARLRNAEPGDVSWLPTYVHEALAESMGESVAEQSAKSQAGLPLDDGANPQGSP